LFFISLYCPQLFFCPPALPTFRRPWLSVYTVLSLRAYVPIRNGCLRSRYGAMYKHISGFCWITHVIFCSWNFVHLPMKKYSEYNNWSTCLGFDTKCFRKLA